MPRKTSGALIFIGMTGAQLFGLASVDARAEQTVRAAAPAVITVAEGFEAFGDEAKIEAQLQDQITTSEDANKAPHIAYTTPVVEPVPDDPGEPGSPTKEDLETELDLEGERQREAQAKGQEELEYLQQDANTRAADVSTTNDLHSQLESYALQADERLGAAQSRLEWARAAEQRIASTGTATQSEIRAASRESWRALNEYWDAQKESRSAHRELDKETAAEIHRSAEAQANGNVRTAGPEPIPAPGAETAVGNQAIADMPPSPSPVTATDQTSPANNTALVTEGTSAPASGTITGPENELADGSEVTKQAGSATAVAPAAGNLEEAGPATTPTETAEPFAAEPGAAHGAEAASEVGVTVGSVTPAPEPVVSFPPTSDPSTAAAPVPEGGPAAEPGATTAPPAPAADGTASATASGTGPGPTVAPESEIAGDGHIAGESQIGDDSTIGESPQAATDPTLAPPPPEPDTQ